MLELRGTPRETGRCLQTLKRCSGSEGEPGSPTKLWDLKVLSLPVSREPTVCWDLVQFLRLSFCTMGQERILLWTSGRGRPCWKSTQRKAQGEIGVG